MPSCLGLYIEQNLIKYAKVSKNNEAIKVESFGIKFYENIGVAIKQIVEETYSFKTPITINVSDEIYNEIEVFSLLSPSDIKSSIKTEFENICFEKELNKNIFEQKYILANSVSGNERIKAIHIAVPKTIIEQRKNQFLEYKISNIIPISIAIENLIKKEKKGTALIVNIEKTTTITKIKNNSVSEVSFFDVGAQDILSKIEKKENSYSKAYEICKNSTIYTESDSDLQYEESEYLEDIMPTVFQIASQIRNIIDESVEPVDKVYITGTAAVINNIDIYFQDYLKNTTCEILKPTFINNNSKINIKDYIEVNSAISLGLYALEKEKADINFLSKSKIGKIWEILNSDMGSENKHNESNKGTNVFLEKISKYSTTVSTTLLMSSIVYITISGLINNQFVRKTAEVNKAISNTQSEIQKIEDYNKRINSLITKYDRLVSNVQDINNINSENKRYRNAIPNLLNYIMIVIPTNVQLTSIENTTDTHIVITAKSNRYQEIAYFKTQLKAEGILENVVSDTGSVSGGYLSVTIEGEMP